MIGRVLTRPPRGALLASPSSSSSAGLRRYAHKPAKPATHAPLGQSDTPEPQEHRRAWFWTAQRLSNYLVIPAVILYGVFFADFGEHEHVFSPPRRWLQQQRDAFFSLTPEERSLAGEQSKETKST
ncbi:hypothetical protein PsYK624_145150 [Phanerochaete sordida]|uniref:Transmembrane protein n=1 Tax=Phanerochaete sordida TaxID=48140 RepID=A0A9P3LL40_9APHY|nr:hypothetical protein PsYK624_145150 [Phanerochaete sordida]